MLSNEKTLKKILAIHNEELVFNTSDYSNDLQGSLTANVKFAQSQILPANPKPGDKQPRLIANRKTLLMVKPLEKVESLQVTVINKQGREVGVRELNRPEFLPSTAYHIDGIPNNIDFTPLPGSKSVINTAAVINQLSDPTGSLLLRELQTHAEVEIRTADGRWTRNIYLPQGPANENKVIRFHSTASYSSTIHYSGRSTTIFTNSTFVFKYLSGQWVWEGDLANQGIIYALNTWSVDLPASWIQPGIAMRFNSGERSGRLDDIPVGAPTELLIHTIDLGMLTTPRDEFVFANDPEAHREYFQTAPISKMIVGQYQSLHLTEVMLPDGQLLTDYDPSQGGVYDGTMRGAIGKELISLGINNANYGINCSESYGERTPYLAAQLTAHNSRGKYANGIITHGLSGGASIVTLEDSLGNEFSHEVGHNYGLGHYPGEFDGSVHQSANSINSTWGWDSDRKKFLPNFRPAISDKPSCYQGTCQATFHGRSFGFDPMAGGDPMAPINRYTLYTPYTANVIQQFMEEKVVFAADSATGFKKWNEATQRMEPYFHHVDTLRPLIASNKDLSASTLAALFANNKMVGVTMADGNWAQTVYLPSASQTNQGALFSFNHNATYSSQLHINGQIVNVTRGFNKAYRSDGSTWQECQILTTATTRAFARNDELDQFSLKNLFSSSRLVKVVISDRDWAPEISVPPAEKENEQRIISIENNSDLDIKLIINGLSLKIAAGKKVNYISNGDRWLQNENIVDVSRQIKPERFGVPVTTLVGYYDPQGELPGYIFPALHGAYGFSYPDDAEQVTESDCQLLVESDGGIQRFKLDNNRLNSDVMNKFHINIAESVHPRTVTLICQGKVVCRHQIQPAKTDLTYTINGESSVADNDLTIAPSGLRVASTTTDSVSLIWDAMQTSVRNYRIYRNGKSIDQSSLPGFTDTGLEEGTQYTYAVSAVYENSEESVLSKTISITTQLSPVVPDVAPAAPGNLRSTGVTASTVALAWDAAAAGSHALESYSIFRSENGGVTSVVASVPASQLSWSDTALKADTRYSYFVIAYDASGKMSARSNTLAVTTEALPVVPDVAPAAPGNLRSTGVTASTVALAWDAAAAGSHALESYSIFRSENGGVTSVVASVPASQLSWSDTGLTADTRYSYFVIAYDASGKMSARSNTLAVTTEALPVVPDVAPAAPAAPGNLRSTGVTASTVALAWDAAAAGSHALESYSIFRSENGGVTSVIASVPASQLSWSDTALKADTRYSYFVIAYDASGKMSARSNTLAVTTEALPVVPDVAPAAPGNLRSTGVTASTVALAWDAAAAGSHALESYSIFRSENGGMTSVIASVPASQLSWSDTGLKADTRYSYFVIAYDASGKMSARSNTLQVTTDTPNTLRTWALGETFQTGERISYQNQIWVCIQGHTAWVMNWAPGGSDSATLWRLA